MDLITDKDYNIIVDGLYDVVSSLVDTDAVVKYTVTMERLARKVFVHAVSIQHLRYGSDFISLNYPNGAHITDFASIYVLSRSVLETYLHLWEIFVESDSDDVITYRQACYELRGFYIRDRFLESIIENNFVSPNELQKKMRQINALREIIKNTVYYQNLDNNQKENSASQGIIYPNRKIVQKGKDAGFGEQFMEKVYAIQSDYSHGGSLSVAQIHQTTTDEEILFQINGARMWVMIIIARMIQDYAVMFAPARRIYNTKSGLKKLVDIFAELGRRI